MRYPTDTKLLWECVEKVYTMMCEASKELGIHRMRTKYLDVAHDNMAYVKQRRHTNKRTRRIIRRQVGSVRKDPQRVKKTRQRNPCAGIFTDKQLAEIETITKIYRHQRKHHESGIFRRSRLSMSYTNVAVMQPLAICIILSIQVRGAKKIKKPQILF